MIVIWFLAIVLIWSKCYKLFKELKWDIFDFNDDVKLFSEYWAWALIYKWSFCVYVLWDTQSAM